MCASVSLIIKEHIIRFLSTMTSEPKHLNSSSECPPLKENELRLYGMRFCPYVQRAALVLAAKDIPYELININVEDEPEWYLKKNPTGQVPLLEWIDQGSKETRSIPESFIISDYLDELFPEKPLQPRDPYLKASQRVLMERFRNVTPSYYKIYRQSDIQKGIEDLNKHLVTYEQELKEKFFAGSAPGIVDYMLWPWFERFSLLREDGFTLNADGKLPKLAAWVNAMEADKAVQKIRVPDALKKKFAESYAVGKPQFDFE